MASTSLQNVSLGIRNIGVRTDFAGAAATDLSAEEDRFANIILNEGLITPAASFDVAAGAGATMNVVVGSGSAKTDYFVVVGTTAGQGNYIVRLESATETFALSAADPANARIDEIYVVVQDNAYDASSRALAVLAIREGTPAGSPAAPGPDAGWDAYALLATVNVPAAAADILACTLTDERQNADLVIDSALPHVVVARGQYQGTNYAWNLTIPTSIWTGYPYASLTVPSHWNTYDVLVTASAHMAVSGGELKLRATWDGSTGHELATTPSGSGPIVYSEVFSGQTTTGVVLSAVLELWNSSGFAQIIKNGQVEITVTRQS